MDQRFYSSLFGRFMGADRFKQTPKANDSGSWNKYSYTRGDPVNRTDVNGNCDEEDGYSGCDPDPLGGGGRIGGPGTPCTDARGVHSDCVGGGGGDAAPPPDPRKCLSSAVSANAASLTLDAAAIAVNFIPEGSSASVLIKLLSTVAVGAAGGAYSAVSAQDFATGTAGLFNGILGTLFSGAGILDAVSEGAKAVAIVPFIGTTITVAQTILDVTHTYQAYSNCIHPDNQSDDN